MRRRFSPNAAFRRRFGTFSFVSRRLLSVVFFVFLAAFGSNPSVFSQNVQATNPNIWADVPDAAVLRVGNDYYMSSTTMHLAPGLPIMKSKNLVDWKIVGYAYNILGDVDSLALRNGANAYGAGSWASSLRYKDGVFYVSTFSNSTGKTHIFSTRDVENGPWRETSFSPALHDHSLFFDDDGSVYMLTGIGDLRLVELNADLSGIKPNGFNDVVIPNAGRVAGGQIGLPAEGSQMFKRNGKYYVCNISWPRGNMRTQIIFRAEKITGPYEGRVLLKDRGIAQGTLVDPPDGRWFAYLFQDSGAVGRIPYLIPVEWVDDWPVLGVDGKVPATLDVVKERDDAGFPPGNIVESDEFDRDAATLERLAATSHQEKENDAAQTDADSAATIGAAAVGRGAFPLAWQWNHNPDARFWSLTERPGWLRLTSGRVDADLPNALNTLTQRTFGPVCSATTKLDASRLNDGDFAGLAAFQKKYGFVGVTKKNGELFIVATQADERSGLPAETTLVPLDSDGGDVYLKIACDFRDRKDEATFYWSADGEKWSEIGPKLRMTYTIPHFMGYRFALFCFATQTTGGAADFDYYRVAAEFETERAAASLERVKTPR